MTLAARYLVEVPLADCKRPTEALELARRANRLEPNDDQVLEVLAQAYAENGLRTEAQETLNRLKALLPAGNETAQRQWQESSRKLEKILVDLGK